MVKVDDEFVVCFEVTRKVEVNANVFVVLSRNDVLGNSNGACTNVSGRLSLPGCALLYGSGDELPRSWK